MPLRRSVYVVAVISCGLVCTTACGSGGAGTNTPPPKTLTSVSVTPSTVPLNLGGTDQLKATATYSDGSTADITTSANWTTTDPKVATVSATGVVTAMAGGGATVDASDSGKTGASSVTVTTGPAIASIAVTPTSNNLIVGKTQQLTATATYVDGSKADISATASWSSSSTTVAGVSSSGLVTAAAAGSATLTASSGGQSATASIVVGANVATWHNDNSRSGLNSGEGILTPQNVNAQSFGKLASYLVDGYIYGQPLVVSQLTINGSVHDVVFVATENDSVYAFDAEQFTSTSPLWQVSLLKSGETPITGASIAPVLGITSTPAIDLTSNTMYVVSTQTSSSTGGTFRLHALNITTGAEKFGGPVTIQAQVPGTNSDSVNGVVHLTTSCVQRPALLVANGSVYIGFGACHSGWLLAYDAQKLTQTGVFNASPDLNGTGTYGGAGGVWMGGGGPVSDGLGNVYITTGNGPYDGKTAFGDSVLKFDSKLNLLDHFTPFDYQYMDCSDKDLAAGGLLFIPGTSEALAGGKSGKLYLVNTTNLGGMQANDAGATQTLWFEADLISPYSASCTDITGTYTSEINSYEIFATSAFFNGSVYLGVTPTAPGVPAPLRQFSYSGTLTPGAYTSDSILQGSYGTTPFISAAGSSSGVVWMIDHGTPIQASETPTSAILRAFDATNLTVELYDSSQTSSDTPGYGIKFTSPAVADGKVFIVTGHDPVTATNPRGELDIYGLKK